MRVMALLALSLATACGNAGTNSDQTSPPDGPPLPADAAILDGAQAPTLLRQCSRSTPEPGESNWQPSSADIAGLEAALPAALAAEGRRETTGAPQGWLRQYAGIVRGGRRFIYGNFVPAGVGRDSAQPDRWRTQVQTICDGGPSFFGVEYDVEARRFTHMAFNGGF